MATSCDYVNTASVVLVRLLLLPALSAAISVCTVLLQMPELGTIPLRPKQRQGLLDGHFTSRSQVTAMLLLTEWFP